MSGPAKPSDDESPSVVDVTDGRLAALRAASAAGAPVRWTPSTDGGARRLPPSPRSEVDTMDHRPVATVEEVVPEAIDLGEVAGPGARGLTITGLLPRPAGTLRSAPCRGSGWTYLFALAVVDAAAVGVAWAAAGGPAGAVGLAVAVAVWCGFTAAAGGYDLTSSLRARLRGAADGGVRAAAATCLTVLAVRADEADGLVVAVPVALLGVLALRAAVEFVRRGCIGPVRVLLVGSSAAVDSAAGRLGGQLVVGRCLVEGPASLDDEDDEGGDVLRRRVAATARAAAADLVLMADPAAFDAAGLRRLAWTLHAGGVDVAVAPAPSGVAARRLRVQTMADLPVLVVGRPVFTGARRVAKSLFDRCAALALLVLLSPLFLFVALAVRVAEPGPVVFRQERVGRHGERFTMLKFRSMTPDAAQRRALLETRNDHRMGVLFKMRADPRVTRIGRLLRRLSLDELPQLVNVLRGDMSLVGPRPALPAEVERYEPDVLRRLLVKPGLTGLWQVSGRADLDWAASVRLDLGYVENWSFGLDLAILRRTVRAVLGGAGAR